MARGLAPASRVLALAIVVLASGGVVRAHGVAPRSEAGVEGTTQRLQLPAGLPEQFEVDVELGGAIHTLRLRRHSLRAPAFRVRVAQADGRTIEVAAPEPATYRGRVVGEPRPRVSVASG